MSEHSLKKPHQRRLRDIWRSSGWPCHDAIELELLAAGLLQRQFDERGVETLRVTDAGLQALAGTRARNRAALDAHEALVARVATEMQRAGRLVWRGLNLRAPLPDEAGGARWAMARPDVFSVRITTVEDYLEPVAHEIKVRRADLLSDLRHPAKAQAYLAMASQCWYVLADGIAEADEIPPEYGVMQAGASGLQVIRPAPKRAMRLPFAAWMALARAHAEPPLDDEAQAGL